ncbi:MAG: DoxX family protein [Acidobacteriota bacterium]|nr:MAG: DoxX family protein [Acidobacteriota bacterium]
MFTESEELSGWKKLILVVTRFAIGWHLFYQGFGKVVEGDWSSVGYLKAGWGPFPWIAEHPTLLYLTDLATVWGLMILGILLMVGLFTRVASILAILQLFMIYVAIPPLDYTGFVTTTERGSELYVNQTLIEVLALMILASFRTGHIMGLDILVRHYRRNR